MEDALNKEDMNKRSDIYSGNYGDYNVEAEEMYDQVNNQNTEYNQQANDIESHRNHQPRMDPVQERKEKGGNIMESRKIQKIRCAGC